MSLNKAQAVIDKWVACRKKTVTSLRSCANELEISHRTNATVEHDSAMVALTGDFIGLCGVLLAPVSGGLSLGLVGVSAVTGVGSYLNKREANKEDDKVKNEVGEELKLTLDKDELATTKLKALCGRFTYMEEQLEMKMIGDILVSIKKRSLTNLDIKVGMVEGSNFESQLQIENSPDIPILGVTTQMANMNAALSSAKEVVRCTKYTKEIISGTRTMEELVSTATSINDISKAAKSLAAASANQTVKSSIQTCRTLAKSAKMLVSIGKGTENVMKTVKATSTVSQSGKSTVDFITASEKIAKTIKKTAEVGRSVSKLTKGAETTIKTVKNVKHASQTVKTVSQVAKQSAKVMHTTRLTSHATKVTKVTKVTQTATKAATISKLGLALNAVIIPLDLYNLVVASGNLEKSHEDVDRIKDEADRLEKEIENMTQEIQVHVDSFTELHIQLCKVYKLHQNEDIYEYLQIMHQKLDLKLPLGN